MAVPARKPKNKQNLPAQTTLTPIQIMCAEMLGRGYSVSQIAERLVDYIIQNSRADEKNRLKAARNRIRKWRKTQAFRDHQWDAAVVSLDNDAPAILQGISRKARAGRVDAAKLALEVTQRHVPKGDTVAANVEVFFEGLPRPARGYDVDGEAEEVEE